jgi:hypothetical protein
MYEVLQQSMEKKFDQDYRSAKHVPVNSLDIHLQDE